MAYRRHVTKTDEGVRSLPFGEQSGVVAARWKDLTDKEKEQFEGEHTADIERYRETSPPI